MDTIMHIQGDRDSHLAPLILIHPVSGLALPYLALGPISSYTDDLSKGRPVYGISSPIFSSPTYRPPQCITQLAAEYVELVREEIQPDGPYLLGGWSMGGMIAAEMATIMQATGDDVLKVIMIDSMNPSRFLPFRDQIEHETLATLSYNAIAKRMHAPTIAPPDHGFSLDSPDISDEGSEKSDDTDSEFDENEGISTKQMLAKVRLHIRYGLTMLSNKPVKAANKRERLETSITLVKCTNYGNLSPALSEDRRHYMKKLFSESLLGWNAKNFRKFKVVKYGATHDGCFDPSHVGSLTSMLRDALEGV